MSSGSSFHLGPLSNTPTGTGLEKLQGAPDLLLSSTLTHTSTAPGEPGLGAIWRGSARPAGAAWSDKDSPEGLRQRFEALAGLSVLIQVR